NTSYTFSGDANGDTATSNDLLYIARDQSEMNFIQNGVFTPAQQAAAWDAYINQDPYLSKHRGEYVERGAIFLPFVHRADFSASQDATFKVGNTSHTVTFRWDVDNFTNLLNSNWGAGTRLVNSQPLIISGSAADANGALRYQLRAINGALMNHPYERSPGIRTLSRRIFSIRYMF